MTAGTQSERRSCQLSSPTADTSPQNLNHSPPFVMPSSTSSYFSRSRFVMTECADSSETGYSGEQPPKMTAILSFLSIFTAS